MPCSLAVKRGNKKLVRGQCHMGLLVNSPLSIFPCFPHLCRAIGKLYSKIWGYIYNLTNINDIGIAENIIGRECMITV